LRFRAVILFVFPLLVTPLCAADLPKIDDFSLSDAGGNVHTPREWQADKAVVLFFLGTECPVSNGYAPEMTRLSGRYGPLGVKFYGVHADPDVTPEQAAAHAKEYGLGFTTLMDPKQTLADQTGVETMPEAVVIVPHPTAPLGQVVYRGRIDNRRTLDGKRREVPTERDLQAAIDAVLAGRDPPVAVTKVYGCPLPRHTK
jgi:peroxiredoxin